MGREGGRDRGEGQKKEGRIKIKATECSPLAFTGWHSLTIPVLWQSWFQPLWIVEQLQEPSLCQAGQGSAHTQTPPHADHGSLHLLLPCKYKRPFTAEVPLLLLGVILCCSILCCWLGYCSAKQQRSPSKELQNASASCRGLL